MTALFTPLSPNMNKKRSLSNASNSHSPVKRLQSLNLPNKFSSSGGYGSGLGGVSSHKIISLGLEGTPADPSTLDDFVEATAATQNDESSRAVRLVTKQTLDEILVERREMSDQISANWGDASEKSEIGFRNFTMALCYRHSLFQALVHTPKFINWLSKYHQPQDCVSEKPDDCVSCKMHSLCTLYWASLERGVKRDHELVELLKDINDLFSFLGWKPDRANDHADPDEQLEWILSRMRIEMPRQVFDRFDSFHNLILESSITCTNCKHVSRTQGQNERQLSVPIKPRVSSSHLALFIKAYMEEVISGYTCEKCKRTSEVKRLQKVVYAPDVLMVQLKRFDYSGRKDSFPVIFGPNLTLSPYALDSSQGPLNYELTATVQHQGMSGFGHYRCLARGPSGGWTEFDDDETYDIENKDAIKSRDNGWTPYLLFYERVLASKSTQSVKTEP